MFIARERTSGFTLVELITVIAIISIITAAFLASYHMYYPLASLNAAVQNLELELNLCKSKAIMTGNNWFMQLNLTGHTYTIVNDDGWLNTTTEVDAWGNPWPPRVYFIGSNDFSITNRNNGLIDANELVKGPFPLGSGKVFLDATNVTQVIFKPDGAISTDMGVSVVKIWIALPKYLEVYTGSAMDGNEDQRKFRRGIKIIQTTGHIQIIDK